MNFEAGKSASLKFLLWAGVLLIFAAGELAYFAGVYQGLPDSAPGAGLVLIYSGDENRAGIAGHWDGAGDPPIFLFSGWDYSRAYLEKSLKLGNRMVVEDRARTTDENARYSAPLIQKTGVKEAVLALPWYHLPRALFLTRYYLWGSGVTVKPYATTPLPKGWFFNRRFWEEAVKFWGSLARVGLSWFGVENWPQPQWGFSHP